MSAQLDIAEPPLAKLINGAAEIPIQPSVKAKKKLVRRTEVDRSQQIRRRVQFAFIGLNLYIVAQFYTWVRFYETSGASSYASRPAGVEGWLPIAALMNLKYFLLTGTVPTIHPAG